MQLGKLSSEVRSWMKINQKRSCNLSEIKRYSEDTSWLKIANILLHFQINWNLDIERDQ